MRERPILFAGRLVRAILDGRKTQTRRVVKPSYLGDADCIEPLDDYPAEWSVWADGERHGNVLCPYGVPGDRLWVRETGWQRPERTPRMMREGADTWEKYYFDADGLDEADHAQFKEWGFKRRPSIFMPRWASRLTLEVVNVRVERLQEISEEDALAEGIRPPSDHGRAPNRSLYASLWDELNGRGAWDANPWVWVVEFKRV